MTRLDPELVAAALRGDIDAAELVQRLGLPACKRPPVSLADDDRPSRDRSARQAVSALEVALAEIQDPEPGAVLPLFVVYDSTSRVGQCGSWCYDAAHGPCGCICTGANHGVGRQQAIRSTWVHALEWLDRAALVNPSILAADILPGIAP